MKERCEKIRTSYRWREVVAELNRRDVLEDVKQLGRGPRHGC